MKRINPDDGPITRASQRKKERLDYLEELKLNITCDEHDTHTAVVYCMKCRTNLCKICSDSIHTPKTLSTHQIVRLTDKPEPSIKCYLHSSKIAKLVCKEPNCKGKNKPICVMCHQYHKHKGHKYELLNKEYDNIRENVASCLKKVAEKRAICDKNSDEYKECILTYSNTDVGFVKSERDKIETFYSEAKASALSAFDDFMDNRAEELKVSNVQYNWNKVKLDDITSKLEKIGKMRKQEMIENGGVVEEFMKEAEEKLKEPTNLIPSKCFNVKFPDAEAIEIKMEINHDDLSKFARFQSKQKTTAVYFSGIEHCEINYDKWTSWVENSENFTSFGKEDNGILYNHRDGRSLLEFYKKPYEQTIDLASYKYTYVLLCDPDDEEENKKQFKEQIKKYWWSRMLIIPDGYTPENETNFEVEFRLIAGTDKRVEFGKLESAPKLFELFLSDQV